MSKKITARKNEWYRWAEAWYLTYAILGATIGGMFPILIPLLALERFGSVRHAGLAMAAFNLGGILAPIWGSIADHNHIHRRLQSSGLIMTAAALACMSFTKSLSLWLVFALMSGIGVSMAVTVGNLFVVEVYPKVEWDERIGWLQSFNSGGQMGGMLLVAILSQIDLGSNLLIAAVLTAIALLPGCRAPKIPLNQPDSPTLLPDLARNDDRDPFSLSCHLNRLGFKNFISFYVLETIHLSNREQLIFINFSIFVLCWPFMNVCGTAFAAQLTTEEGKGMGVFNAVFAIACMTGAAAGSWLAAKWGYQAASCMAIATETLGLIFLSKTKQAQLICVNCLN